MNRKIDIAWKSVKTYKAEATCIAAVEKVCINLDRYFTVQNPADGRWTAVVVIDKSVGGYMGRPGFMIV